MLGYDDIYLFSWNKNKFIRLKKDSKYEIINRKDVENIYCEQILEERNKLDLDFVKYEDILKDFIKLDWNKESKLLKACYIFAPIVG